MSGVPKRWFVVQDVESHAASAALGVLRDHSLDPVFDQLGRSSNAGLRGTTGLERLAAGVVTVTCLRLVWIVLALGTEQRAWKTDRAAVFGHPTERRHDHR